MSENKHLYYSEEFQFFLRSQEGDVTKSLQSYPKLTAKDIVEKYKENFDTLNGKTIDSEVFLKISNINGFLKSAKQVLHQYREKAKELAHAKHQFNQSLVVMFEQLIPDYEKNCLHEYISGDETQMIFNNEKGTPKLQETRKTIKESQNVNPFSYIYDMISFEYRDCEAFLEALQAKDFYEKKRNELLAKIRDQEEEQQALHQGKTTFKSIFSKGTNEAQKQKLEQSITDNKIEAECMNTLIDLITAIIGFIEIEKFKKNKRLIYHSVMRSVSVMEIKNNQLLITLWNEVSDLTSHLLQQ